MTRPLPRLALATALLAAAHLSLLVESAWAVTFEKRTVASADDAEATNTNSMYLDSSDLEMVVDGSTTQSAIGMRWTGVTIPKGATITTAYIQFTARESHTETTNLTLVGQAADNATTFTTTNGNLTPAVRPRTAATVSWPNVGAWTANATGAAQRTPELKTILQEIVNRNLWASGNALVLLVTGSGHRTAYAYDGNAAQAPLLHVEYTTGPPPNNAPVAGLSVTQPPTPPLTVNANGSTSTDTDAFPIATYRFDFGDGTPTVTANAPTATASHAYATAGAYTVTLTVTDTGNLTSAPVTQTITVQPENPPVASLSVTHAASPVLTVLANGAGSTDGDLTPIASYRFDFGDGTPTVTANAPTTTASHTYASPGAYTVTLVAVDTGGNASAPVTQSITVELPDDPPVARLTVTQRPTPPNTVDADASASTDVDATGIATYHFDFGDGTPTVTASAPTSTASHVYAATGTYTVTLLVTDTAGKTSAPATRSITVVPDDAPVASLVLTQPPIPERTVHADASGSTDGDLTPIATYRFDFHDGSPLVETYPPTATASHTYSSAGPHSVSVTVVDAAGNVSTTVTQPITVQPENPPVASLSLSQAASPFLTVVADGSGSTDGDLTPVTSYRFDFHDGSPTVTANAPTATARHTYALPGSHSVTLVAVDAAGLESAPVTQSILVVAPPENPPVAHLTVTRAPVPALVVNADASGSTDEDLTPIASYHFDFGDGTPTVTANAPTATASHTYAAQGTYTVTLIVVDTGGFASTPVTQSILVQPPNQAPVAQLALTQPATPARTVIADAAGSTDTDHMPIGSYRFNFGDGSPNVTVNAPTTTASHAYATPGNKTVTVVAIDTGNLESAPVSRTINVLQDNPPTPQLALTQPATPPRTVVADASASTDGDLTPIASYRFTWGDGTPTTTANAPTATATHAYATAGSKTVTLVVTDTGGNASSPITRTINVVDEAPPVASLSVTQQSTPALTVQASAAGSTDGDLTPIATYRFDFGDGTPTVTANAPANTATHTYAAAGGYTVTLIATDTGGFSSAPVARVITVTANNPPVASLSVSQTGSLAVTANGSGSTDGDAWPIASYRFTWGDGTPTTTANAPTSSANHTYAAAGTYTITLIATDTGNLSSAPASQSFTVVQSGTVDKRVAAGSDDAEQTPNGNVNVTSSDLELVQDAQTQTVGLRFTGINVPRNAVITNAWIQFDAKESHTEATALTIQGEASDNPTTFTTGSNNVSGRARTSSYTTWNPVPSWTSTAGQGPSQRTPNLAFPVQQIVNRAGWNSGQAMAFIISGSGHRTAYSYEGGSTRAPLLHIEYGNGSPPPQQAPVASFTATSSILTASVDASASTDGDLTPIASYRFDWGDGTSTTTLAPSATASHTYATAGTKTITLVVTDTGNNVSAPTTRTVTVVPPTPPTARLTVTPNALVVTASGATSTAGSYPIASYRFTWGDNTPTTTATAPTTSANHTYAAPGTYAITLVVTDTQNLSSAPASASVTVTNTPTSGTVDKRVTLGSDDAEQAASGSVSVTSADLELVQDSSTQTVGLRFQGINIPRNAVISNAYIQFDARESHSEATTLTIRGEAADNAVTFTTGSNNVSGRSKTTSYTTWTPATWNSSDGQGANQRTPQLAFPIQQIVNRSGWNSGNAMAFIITGTGHRTAYSFEGGSTRAPLLHIDWGGTAPPQQAPVARLTVTAAGLVVSADGSASTDGDTSPIASYRFQWGDGTSATTVNAPNATASHTYAVSGTYTVTLTCTDTGGRVSSPVSQSITVSSGGGGGGSGIAVYAGYYSTHHPDNPRPKPTPWFGSPGITFVGVPDDGVSSGWDTSGIRIDNLGTSGLTNVSVTCDIGSNRFALWSAQNIPAGGRLILAQTGYENFDGSDTNPAGCYDCDPNDCLTKVVTTVPVVNVTIGGTTTRYYDNAQTINTEGVDAAGCPYTGGRNDESRTWVRIYPAGGAASADAAATAPDSTGAGTDSTDAVARAIANGPRLAWVRRPYPNPSRGRIELMFRIGRPGNVEIGMYDIAGRLMRDVSRVDLEAGDYLQQVNLTGMSPGMYYFTISTPEGKIRHPLVIVR